MRIILIGLGNVGKNFVKLLLNRQKDLMDNFGLSPRIVAVVDSKGASRNPRGLDFNGILKIKEEMGSVGKDPLFGEENIIALDIIREVEAEVVIEASSTELVTGEPAMSHIENSIKMGKHVISTNKGPLALALPALIELAEYNQVMLRFSGTVGGGTPILDFGRKCLTTEKIVSLKGILNGTTNYILSKMDFEGTSFEEALKFAQNLGYAEAEPSTDIDGIDTACKLVILANWVLKRRVTLKDVKITGIRQITRKDLREANNKKGTIKLIGSISENIKVEPLTVLRSDPMCVNGTLNAVTFSSLTSGDQTIIGRGAGGMETASSILRDLINIRNNISGRERF
jgi:homoserine dehydrogenase